MSTMSGSPFLPYSGTPRALTQINDPSKRMWSRIEQTTAIANARCAGSVGSGSLTIADYATLSIGLPTRRPASGEGNDSVVETKRRSNALHGFLRDAPPDGAPIPEGFGDDPRTCFEVAPAFTDRREQLLEHPDETLFHRHVAYRSPDVSRKLAHLVRVGVEGIVIRVS